jgi:CBS domain-containing protein
VRRRGEDGAAGVVSSCPRRPSSRYGTSVTETKRTAPARNGKSAFRLENLTRSLGIRTLLTLARELKSPTGEHMDTTAPEIISSAEAALPRSDGPHGNLEQVGARARAALVKVPSWFTVAAGLRVAQLKGVAHLLVLDRGRVAGTIATSALAEAPATDPIARWMTPATTTVACETPVSETLRLMAALGLACVPISAGPLLVGLVTRDDLAAE